MTRELNPEAFGFYLGALSKDSLRKVLNQLFDDFNKESLYVIAKASWRNSLLMMMLDKEQVVTLAEGLVEQLGNKIQSVKQNCTKTAIKRELCTYLELLFGLLRTRKSEDQDIQKIFQPSSDYVQKLTAMVEDLTKFVITNRLELGFRVIVEVCKEESDPTPDFLYALQSYLTGDDNSNSIRVTGITEENS